MLSVAAAMPGSLVLTDSTSVFNKYMWMRPRTRADVVQVIRVTGPQPALRQ